MISYEYLPSECAEEFEQFVQNHKNGNFMQSVNWVKAKKGWLQQLCVVRRDGEIVGGFAAIIRKVGPVSYIYVPRGPVCDYGDSEVVKALIDGAKQLVKKHKALEFVFDPLLDVGDEKGIGSFTAAGCEFLPNAPFSSTVQPRYNYIVDLNDKDEESLMASFVRETRYYVRYPAKKGIVCKHQPVEMLDDFYDIYKKTGERQGFNIRPKEYLEGFLRAFPEHARLYVCYNGDEALCGGIAVQYAGRTAHVYGASTDKNRNLRPTYLLQWTLMQWALEGGCHTYDMQGVAVRPEDSEQLYNVLGFKRNFTGEIYETAGEFKLPGNRLLRAIAKKANKI